MATSASNRRLGAVVEQAKARVDLPEADLLEQDLADHLLAADPEAQRWRADSLEQDLAGLLEVDLVEVLAVVVLEDLEHPAAVDPLVEEEVLPRTRSSIPRMAKFPTRRLLARSPTT